MYNYLINLPYLVIKDLIINRLLIIDLINLSKVDKYFYEILSDENLWRYKYIKDFKSDIKLKKRFTWKMNYIKLQYNNCRFCYKPNKLFHIFYPDINICKECQTCNIKYKTIQEKYAKKKYYLNNKDISISKTINYKNKIYYLEHDIINMFKNKFITQTNYYNYINSHKFYKLKLLELKSNNEMFIIREFVKIGYIIPFHTDITKLNKYSSGFLNQFLKLKNPKCNTKNKIMYILIQYYYTVYFIDTNNTQEFKNIFVNSILDISDGTQKNKYISNVSNPLFIEFYDNIKIKYHEHLKRRDHVLEILISNYNSFFINSEYMIKNQINKSKIYNYIFDNETDGLSVYDIIEYDIHIHFFINYTLYDFIKSQHLKSNGTHSDLQYKKEAYKLFIDNNSGEHSINTNIMVNCVDIFLKNLI